MDVDTVEWIGPMGASSPHDNHLILCKVNYQLHSSFAAGNLTEAARCAGTHSYMAPGDQEMVTNVEYYRSSGAEDEWFTPRPEAVDYVLRHGVIRLLSLNCHTR